MPSFGLTSSRVVLSSVWRMAWLGSIPLCSVCFAFRLGFFATECESPAGLPVGAAYSLFISTPICETHPLIEGRGRLFGDGYHRRGAHRKRKPSSLLLSPKLDDRSHFFLHCKFHRCKGLFSM